MYLDLRNRLRKLHIEELHNLYSSGYSVRMINPRAFFSLFSSFRSLFFHVLFPPASLCFLNFLVYSFMSFPSFSVSLSPTTTVLTNLIPRNIILAIAVVSGFK